MHAKFINPVLKATVETLQMMANLKISPDRPQLKSGLEAKGIVTSILEMNGANIRGSLAISFTFPLIQQLAKSMLDLDINKVDEIATDLTGELSNIVTGRSKALLSESGFDIDMATPSSLTGEPHTIDHKINAPVIIIPFHTPHGSFFVEICFKA